MAEASRKPVCLIIAVVASGGSVGAAVVRDALEAVEKGYEVYVASGRTDLPAVLLAARVKHIRIGWKADAALHYVISRLWDAEGRGSVLATLRFNAAMHRLGPSFIILHNVHGHFLNLALLVRGLRREVEAGAEIVWVMHDFWLVTGHCAFLPSGGCQRFTEAAGCGDCPMRDAYPRTLVDRSRSNFRRKKRLLESLAAHSEVQVVSRWQEELVRKSFLGAARIKLRVPRVAMEFTPPLPGEKRGSYALCVAYPWQKYKGLDDLPALRRALPREMRLLVVGLNDRQSRKLRPLDITCLPRLSNPLSLALLYRGAGVYISLSYAETYGLTVREALACGTPVALYAVGGITEGLEGHPKVRAVPCGDVSALASAAVELASETDP